jgi:hypothetical protein
MHAFSKAKAFAVRRHLDWVVYSFFFFLEYSKPSCSSPLCSPSESILSSVDKGVEFILCSRD